ncbi:MAG: cation transporter [Clostridia bacterium]|nr:cation transporter [Clostridia bacterium]
MQTNRDKKIIRTSVFGIIVNAVLVVFKGAVGLLANSVAVLMDAVNNLSDVLSSVITIIGTKLSSKKPDKKHPYGHGRIEYITSVIIAFIILFAGVTSLKESITKIITPEETDYKIYSLVIIAVAVIAKILLGRYVSSVGRSLDSTTLIASGADATFDAVLSFATLVSAIIALVFKFYYVEGILGAIISLFIFKAGIGILSETLDGIIGVRADSSLTDKITATLEAHKEVRGAYDLTLHTYGPTKIIGSVHVEVDEDLTAKEIHKLTRMLSVELYEKLGIIMTIGIYSSSDTAGIYSEMKTKLLEIISKYPEVLQMHGLYIDEENSTVTFDIIVDFSADAEAFRDKIIEEISNAYPHYKYFVVLDNDFAG